MNNKLDRNGEAETYQEVLDLIPMFIDVLRAHPQVPVKPTTNIGGTNPLKFDLLEMMRAHIAKAEATYRLEPERFIAESRRARELFFETASAQGENFRKLLGRNPNAEVSLNQMSSPDGFALDVIMTNNGYAEWLAIEAEEELNLSLPSYSYSVASRELYDLDSFPSSE